MVVALLFFQQHGLQHLAAAHFCNHALELLAGCLLGGLIAFFGQRHNQTTQFKALGAFGIQGVNFFFRHIFQRGQRGRAQFEVPQRRSIRVAVPLDIGLIKLFQRFFIRIDLIHIIRGRKKHIGGSAALHLKIHDPPSFTGNEPRGCGNVALDFLFPHLPGKVRFKGGSAFAHGGQHVFVGLLTEHAVLLQVG